MPNNTPAPLVVRGLCKNFGAHEVLRGVDLTVQAGSIHGLVGLNGAGKTTALECLLGLQSCDRGDLALFDLPPTQLYKSRGRVAVVFDEPCLHAHLTVGQALAFAQLSVGVGRDDAAIDQLEQLLGIQRYHTFKLRELSLGNRRRTSIAQALVGKPEFIILDEPFNGLDAGGVEDVLALIQRLSRESGMSFLLASHQLSYLERICTHLSILHLGRVIVSDDIKQLLASDATRVHLVTNNPEQARLVIHQMVGATLVQDSTLAASNDMPGRQILCELQGITSAQLNRTLVNEGIDVDELMTQKLTLDRLFRQATQGDSVVGSAMAERQPEGVAS